MISCTLYSGIPSCPPSWLMMLHGVVIKLQQGEELEFIICTTGTLSTKQSSCYWKRPMALNYKWFYSTVYLASQHNITVYLLSIWRKKVWWINRSGNWLLIERTNLVWWIMDDSPNLPNFLAIQYNNIVAFFGVEWAVLQFHFFHTWQWLPF